MLSTVPWFESQNLGSTPEFQVGDRTGDAVAIQGDTIVVGARRSDVARTDGGSAYIYQRDDQGTPMDRGDDQWLFAQQIVPSDLNIGDWFGHSIAFEGNRIAIGADHPSSTVHNSELGDGLGVVYVYEYQTNTSNWVMVQKLEPTERGGLNDRFGKDGSVSLEGDLLTVGAIWDDNTNGEDAGAVHVFRFDGTQWTQEAKLTASNGQPFDEFGRSVTFSDGTIYVGARYADGITVDSGAVYVFSETLPGVWTETDILSASVGQSGDDFGFRVTHETNTLIISAPGITNTIAGAVYVFNDNNGSWAQEAKLVEPTAGAGFGTDLDLDQGLLAISDWHADGQITGSGVVFIWERVDGQWIRSDKIISSDPTLVDGRLSSFGFSVDLNAGELVVGDVNHSYNGVDSGAAYVFVQDQTRKLDVHVNDQARSISDAKRNRSKTTTSSISVSETGTLIDVNVHVDITHPRLSDLQLSLVSPTGTRIRLATNVGGSGDNFQDTHFDDESSNPIANGSAPFQATFRPEESLGLLVSEELQGTWTLEIVDDTRGSSGTLNGWRLITKYDLPVATPGISVTPTSGLITTEDGGQATFDVVLDAAPTADVTITISSSDPSEGLTNETSLTFTSSDWNIARTVYVTGQDDPDLDGDIVYGIITGSTFSLDPNYNGLNPGDVSVTNLDNETPPTPTFLFQDSFENGQWNGLWVEDSQNDWFTSTQRATDGNYSAEVDGRATDATLTVANPIDLSGNGSAKLSFDWLIENGFDSGEYLALDFFDGNNWIEVLRLDGNVDPENTWHSETVTLESQYLNNDFQFRYRADVNRSNEDANVDNVKLEGNSGAFLAEVTGSGSEVIELNLQEFTSFNKWTPTQDPWSGPVTPQIDGRHNFQMETADSKRLQLALPPTEQRFFQTELQDQLDREFAAVGLPEDTVAKTVELAWVDFDLTDKLFGEFDRLLDELEFGLT